MIWNRKYKTKVFGYFLVVFLIFALSLSFYQYQREKDYQKEKLELLLNKYALLLKSSLPKSGEIDSLDFKHLKEIVALFPDDNLRTTIIDLKGKVLFDTQKQPVENHLDRPEIIKADKNGFGSFVRFSNTTKENYYYYALKTNNYFLRTALPYTKEVESLLKVNHLFTYFILSLFVVSLFLLLYATEKVGNSVSRLRDFAINVINNHQKPEIPLLDHNEVGEISLHIHNMYQKLQGVIAELSLEKEKLLMHIQSAKDGLCIFSADNKPLVYNKHFVQFVNFLSEDKEHEDLAQILSLPELSELKLFLSYGKDKRYSCQIEKSGKILSIELIIFLDKSFEINIQDITSAINEKRFKQEMTSNIAHELKTPVAAIQGFLETILNNPGLDEGRYVGFIEKAYNQIKRLADLIGDISIINRLDESKGLFKIEPVNIRSLIKDIIYDFELRMQANHIGCKLSLDSVNKDIYGSPFLLDAIFRNLVDNAIKYGGKFIDITISCLNSDEEYYYFCVKDSGAGVPEEDLARIFERFYRVDKGRGRSLGGTGLGLAIVKNAVEFHKGTILVKSQLGKGTEFSFSIAKKRD